MPERRHLIAGVLVLGLVITAVWWGAAPRTSGPPPPDDALLSGKKVAESVGPSSSLASQLPAPGPPLPSVDVVRDLVALRKKFAASSELEPVLAHHQRLVGRLDLAGRADYIAHHPFSEDEMPLIHSMAYEFGARATKDDIEHVIGLAQNAPEESMVQLATLLRFVTRVDGLDALQSFVLKNALLPGTGGPLLAASTSALARTGDAARLEPLIGLASSIKDPGARENVAAGLSGMTSPGAVSLLVAIAKDAHALSNDSGAKEMAVRMMGQVKDELARDTLLELKASADPVVAGWASDAVVQLRSLAPRLFVQTDNQ